MDKLKPLVLEVPKYNDDDRTHTYTEIIIAPNYMNDYKRSVKELKEAPIYFELNENHSEFMSFTTLTKEKFDELYNYMTQLKNELENAE